MHFELESSSTAWDVCESVSLNHVSSKKVQSINAEVHFRPAKGISSLKSEVHREIPNDCWIAAYIQAAASADACQWRQHQTAGGWQPKHTSTPAGKLSYSLP
jgi:hypothetical protein